MGLLDLFGKKAAPTNGVFAVQCELHPYSLRSHENDFVDLEISLQNQSDVEEMTSVVVEVGKGLGLDRSAIQQEREIRLGFLKPGESKFLKVQVWATQRTEKGVYDVSVAAIAHFHDYSHVLNMARRRLSIRVE